MLNAVTQHKKVHYALVKWAAGFSPDIIIYMMFCIALRYLL